MGAGPEIEQVLEVELSLERVLQLRPHLRLAVAGDEIAFVLGEVQRFVVSHGSAAAILSLLDGKRSVAEVVELARPKISRAQVLHTLGQMESQGLLTEAETGTGAESRFWSSLGVSPARRDHAVKLCVADSGGELDTLPTTFCELLQRSFVNLQDEARLCVIASEDYLNSETDQAVRAAIERDERCFLLKVGGSTPWIGPLLSPGRGPCWECLRHALRWQRPVETFLERIQPGLSGKQPFAATEASVRLALSLAVLELERLLAAGDFDQHRICTFELSTFNARTHWVRRRPQCPACGDPRLQAKLGERPVELNPRQGRFSDDGGYRTESPEFSYQRLLHLVSPLLGPVTHLEPCETRGAGRWPVFRSGFLVCPEAPVVTGNAFDRFCAGKGRTVAQARASALCEALERFAGVYRGDEATLRASLRTLGEDAVTPQSLQLFSRTQLERPSTPRAHPGQRVPRPLDPDTAIDWTPAWSLTNHRRRYVPLSFCYTESPLSSGSEYCVASSNGCAAGNCIEEAVLQGLLELIERDAVAIWWYNRLTRPSLGTGDGEEGWQCSPGDPLAAQGWTSWLLNLTHDLSIPVVGAVCEHLESGRFALGFGCHLRLGLAAQRAIAELYQVFDSSSHPTPWDSLRGSDRSFLRPAPSSRGEGIHDAIRQEPDLKAVLEVLVAGLAALGLEVLVVNKSRPEIELSVVQVLVPGLCHIWPRFGVGRLYEVPSRLGWRERALTEAELNPIPLLL